MIKKFILYTVIIILSVALPTLLFGNILSTTYDAWMLTGDRKQLLTAWNAFRVSYWSFPLGFLPILNYPIGTYLSILDGIPILSIPAKLVFDIFNINGQPYGYWVVLCFFLQALFGYLIVAKILNSPYVRALGFITIWLAPPFLLRFHHLALSAQWLVLFGIYLSLDSKSHSRKRVGFLWALVLFLASGVHYFLFLMVSALAFTHLIKLTSCGRVKVQTFWVCVCLYLVLAFCSFLSLGYFSAHPFAPGFGNFSSDVLTFFNPQERYFLLPAQFYQPSEGMSYMGLGLSVGLLTAFGCLLFKIKKDKDAARNQFPIPKSLIILALAFFLLAILPIIRLGGHVMIDLSTITDSLWPIPAIFRSNGRFIWIPYYISILLVLCCIDRLREPYRILTAIICLLLQTVDIGHLFLSEIRRQPVSKFMFDFKAIDRFKIVYVFPPEPPLLCGGKKVFTPEQSHFLQDLYLYTTTHHIAVNSMYTPRYNILRWQRSCRKQFRSIRASFLNRRSVVLFIERRLMKIATNRNRRLRCDKYTSGESIWICYSQDLNYNRK